MRNDFCSNYLAHAKGVEWKNHKYVAKLKLANGKFFYFYSQAQYDAYINKMKKRNDANREAINEKLGIKKETPKVEEKKPTTSTETTSKSGKKSGSKSGSSKSSGGKTGKSSSGSKSSSSKSSSEKKSSSKSEKKSSEKTSTSKSTKKELSASKAVTTKGEEVTAQDLKDKYGVKDEEITAHEAAKAQMEMLEKYEDGAFGFITVGSTMYKWDKSGGQIHLYDFKSEKEIPFDSISNALEKVNEFRIDDKKKKDQLSHHGILGMKWGRKNGPPYPLGSEDHSAREKKAGWRKSLGSGRNEELYGKSSSSTKESKPKEKKQFHLTEGQKKAIKIGAAVAATTLIAYGGYKLTRSPKVRALISKGMQGSKATRMANIEKAIQNSGPEIVKKTKNLGGSKSKVIEGVFKKKENYVHSVDKTLGGINPNYRSTSFHLLSERDMAPLDTVNCVACCQTYELKARGFDGVAQLIDTRNLSYRDTMRAIYGNKVDSLYKPHVLNSWSDAAKQIASEGAGARGNIGIPFAKGGGHNIVFDIDGSGKPWFIDAQSGGKFDDLGKLSDFLVQEHGPDWQLAPRFVSLRTDNLEYNSLEAIRKLVAG